jgi:hypothetical protein
VFDSYGFATLFFRALFEVWNLLVSAMFDLIQSWPLLQRYLPFANFIWVPFMNAMYHRYIRKSPAKGSMHLYKQQDTTSHFLLVLVSILLAECLVLLGWIVHGLVQLWFALENYVPAINLICMLIFFATQKCAGFRISRGGRA